MNLDEVLPLEASYWWGTKRRITWRNAERRYFCSSTCQRGVEMRQSFGNFGDATFFVRIGFVTLDLRLPCPQ